MPADRIAVILLNWNGREDTLACLRSLEALTYPHVETIVVDNGSQDGSVEAIRTQFPDITLIEAGRNLGFAGGNNLGIRYALKRGFPYLLLLNNDTSVCPGLLEGFLEGVKSGGDLLGAKLYLYTQPDTFDHFGGRWNQKRAQFALVALREKEDNSSWETPLPLDYACGCALFIKREVFDTVGLLDPRFFLIWEEADLCFRARRAGFRILLAPKAKVWHKVSASFTGGKPHSAYFWWRNRLLWIERNCSRKEQLSLFFVIILPEVVHHLKLWLLKMLLPPARCSVKRRERWEKQRKRAALLAGVRDYCLRRFGEGPSWLYRRYSE